MTAGLTLGEKIRALRKQLKMTQQDLAGNNFTKSFISQIEKNEANPSIKSLQIIARRLSKPVSFFFDEEDLGSEQEGQYPRLEQLIRMGKSLQQNGELSKASECFHQVLNDAPETAFLVRGKAYLNLGSIAQAEGNYKHAATFLEHGRLQFQLAQSWHNFAITASTLGAVYCKQGDYARSIEALEAALQTLNKQFLDDHDDYHLRLKVLTNLGIALCRAGHSERALPYLREALTLSPQTEDYYKYGDVCLTIGYALNKQGEPEEAVKYTEKAFSFYRAIGNTQMLVRACINLGAYYRQMGKPEESAACLRASEKMTSSIDDTELICTYCYEAARTHLELGNREAARNYCRQALEYADISCIMAAKVNRVMATVYQDNNDLDSAIAALDRAVSLLDTGSGDNSSLLAELYSDLGLLYQQKGETGKANEYLSRSVTFFRSQGGDH